MEAGGDDPHAADRRRAARFTREGSTVGARASGSGPPAAGLGRAVSPVLSSLTLPGYGEAAAAMSRTTLGARQRARGRAALLFARRRPAPPWVALQAVPAGPDAGLPRGAAGRPAVPGRPVGAAGGAAGEAPRPRGADARSVGRARQVLPAPTGQRRSRQARGGAAARAPGLRPPAPRRAPQRVRAGPRPLSRRERISLRAENSHPYHVRKEWL